MKEIKYHTIASDSNNHLELRAVGSSQMFNGVETRVSGLKKKRFTFLCE